MSAFAKVVNGWKVRVATNLANHGVPPTDKLIGFIGGAMVPSLKGSAEATGGSAPDDLASAFTEHLTWDLEANAPSGEPTAEGLQAALDELHEKHPIVKRGWAGIAAASAGPDGAPDAGAGGGGAEGGPETAGEAEPKMSAEEYAFSIRPTDEELADHALACGKIWELDDHRLDPGSDYIIDLGRGKKPYHEGDSAPNPLFTHVDEDIWEIETFRLFRSLLDNYERSTGKAEIVTRSEREENMAFLRAIMKTRPMKYVHNFLFAKGKADEDPEKFIDKLYDIWFDLYRRDARNDSSGFEHVFVGEEDDDTVKGMHNWLMLYLEEKRGTLDYRGYIFPRRRSTSHENPEEKHLITIQFAWQGDLKPVSTSFVGVSPEFEMAIYTLCFFMEEKETRCLLGPYPCKIRCYSFGRRDPKVGTAFPDTD